MPMWTEVHDVRDRWVSGTLTATDSQIETLLDDAEDTILGEFPTIQTDIDNAAIPLARVRKVAARVVIRHLRNPDGVRATSEGAGPFQRQTTYGGSEPGAMYLTDEDRAELGNRRGGRAFQIDSTPLDLTATAPDPWTVIG